jgi:SAM-dependent MidA family methyltransferase
VSDTVLRALRAAIEEQGPLSFATFMEHALYGPGGFYEHPPVGEAGDFVTSPHVHPVFAELLARGLRELWELQERPDPWHLVEVGAGDGTLARQLLVELRDLPVAYGAVEIGPVVQALAAAGIGRVTDRLDGPAHVVVANELLDNLPFRVVRGGREVRVGFDGRRLVEVVTEPDDELRRLMPSAAAEEDLVIPVGAFAFIDRLADVLAEGGYALLIDYGAEGSTGGPLHGYRAHHLVDDVLAAPGTADVTAGVDVAAIAAHAEAVGLTAFPSVTQHDALMALGFESWFRGELARQHDALETRDGLAAVRTWSGRSRASILADPGGLGRFRWLLLTRPGVPVPTWYEAATGPTAD